MEVKDKIVRKFKDSNNNFYEIRKKANGHFCLIVNENGKSYGRIFNGSKIEIFKILQKMHKETNFISY